MKIKLTIVTIWYRGVRHPFLVEATVDRDGTAKISDETLRRLLRKAGVPNGACFGIG